MAEDYEPWVDPIDLAAANRRHDAELAAAGISIEGRVNCSWNPAKLSLRGPLTDKKINAYEKAGFYSIEYRTARKKLMDKKSARRGNFVERDGRLIYAP